ncbi:hypothetical protein BH24PSE2_BH24PSE2_03520 [soil metagenome]
MLWWTLLAVAVLAAMHLLAGQMKFLTNIPRSRWLSMAGGVAVAYVFVHLLPELSEHQKTIAEATLPGLIFIEHHVYLVALAGLVAFYGLERAVKTRLGYEPSGEEDSDSNAGEETDSDGVFWLHVASYSFYNALIGYLLLHREETGLASLGFYTFAMGVHFISNDFGLSQDHKKIYDRLGRWILAAAIIAGWLLAVFTEISEKLLAVLFAFLAGGVVLNVLKEELPAERKSNFGAFLIGAALYTILLLL